MKIAIAVNHQKTILAFVFAWSLSLLTSLQANAQDTNSQTCQKPEKPQYIAKDTKNNDALKDFINYFCISQDPEDEDVYQAFPWRKFRERINNINSNEEVKILISSLPSWPNCQDQESLSIMCDKISKLSDSYDIDSLISIIKSPISDFNRGWALESIERMDNKNHRKLLETYAQENISESLLKRHSKEISDSSKKALNNLK